MGLSSLTHCSNSVYESMDNSNNISTPYVLKQSSSLITPGTAKTDNPDESFDENKRYKNPNFLNFEHSENDYKQLQNENIRLENENIRLEAKNNSYLEQIKEG